VAAVPVDFNLFVEGFLNRRPLPNSRCAPRTIQKSDFEDQRGVWESCYSRIDTPATPEQEIRMARSPEDVKDLNVAGKSIILKPRRARVKQAK
jgi:hypothetical protein